MRLERLQLDAFGPYADSEIIDFTPLLDQPLVLIHGPTGAGKSSILDAICYALFGETSGGDRSGQQMRCDQADEDRLTEVTFDFGFQGRHYRVRRSPTQQRPKLRGDGFTTHSAHATLYDRTDVFEEPSRDGSLVVDGKAAVDKHVHELFGFTADQFRQVVMLPQGQFRKLLLAESKDKEAILERLFPVSLYDRVTQKLRERERELYGLYKDASAAADGLLEHAQVETEAQLAHQVQELAAQAEEKQALAQQARATSKKATEALQQAEKVQQTLDEQRQAGQALHTLKQQASQQQQRRDRLAAAEKARQLADVLVAVTQAAERERKARTDLGKAAAGLQRAADADKAAQAALQTQQQPEQQAQREQAAEQVRELRAQKELVAELDQAREALGKATRQAEEAQATVGRLGSQLEQTAARVQQLTQQVEPARTRAVTLEGCELQHEKLTGQQTLASRRALAVVERDRKQANATDRAEQADRATEQAGKARQQHQDLRRQWRQAQATVLARLLENGEPCPVCGATEHPAPAHADSSAPSDAQLDQAAQRADDLAAQAEQARLTAQKARSDADTAAQKVKDLDEQLEGVSLDDLSRRVEEAARALRQARQAKEHLPDLEKNLGEATGQAEELQRRLDAAREALSGHQAEQKARQAVLDDRLAKVPEALREHGALDRALARAETHRATLEEALSDARQAAQQAQTALATATERHSGARTAAAQAAEDLTEARDRLTERRQQAGLAQEQAWQTARADVPQIDTLRTEVQAYDRNLAAARDRVERADAAAEGLQAPQLDVLKNAAAQAEEQASEATSAHATASAHHRERQKLLEDYRNKMVSARQVEQEHRVVSTVSQVAQGRGNNALNLSFKNFVLAVLLDEVLVQASERLHKMSRGRYRLVRNPEVKHGAKAAGLELSVTDAHNGGQRDVETLSGGESFLAALSLSLGLSDVIQGASGGVQLDTLFIDEGFGTLDPESLDGALSVLNAMHAGQRLVAIISHVTELQTRIDNRLQVEPTERGSRTHLVVG